MSSGRRSPSHASAPATTWRSADLGTFEGAVYQNLDPIRRRDRLGRASRLGIPYFALTDDEWEAEKADLQSL